MLRRKFNEYIDSCQFKQLFIEMGWNRPTAVDTLPIIIGEKEYEFEQIAEKQGFQVFTCSLPEMPTSSECKKIDNQLRKFAFDNICIFVESANPQHHLWLTPIKTNEKRELVKVEYIGAEKADFLWSKVDDLSFGLEEVVHISDVKQRIQGVFHLNSEKITSDFFKQFKKEHVAFKKYISGIDDNLSDDHNKNKDWYASIMLNRLMFCYFIQKKGFLDLNTNYLQDKLRFVKAQQGENKFFGTFYKGFLCAMFHEGLNNPRHDSDEFRQVYGRIPYLNGGMFEEHQLELDNPNIDIADVAFENLFSFFDQWNWHLDTRLTASGKDINPDVLGYIFEQYINDRAAMGAYYTKEDITEYIGKNCIIPFLMDKTQEKSPAAFKSNGFVLQNLKSSKDKYIYDAVKKGYTPDWQSRIPDYIQQGIPLLPEQHNLLERRARWNEKTFAEFALPTEIWRETIERLQRCETLLQKISDGEIKQINDFITYNLDIRLFAEDLLRTTTDHLYVKHFYETLQHVTILDPTCGSGAFLFAALNILEPLYEACLDRMEEWHKENPNLFKEELEEMTVKYGSNRQYFIYKSIILRNLYGVDIMVEATEIAKLRLFLKMVAVVDVDRRKDNLGLEPLPDIDFNIKCGNTLVGYATESELDKALAEGDMFANAEFKEKISEQMNIVATAYNCFRSEQLKTYDDNASIKATKGELKKRLAALNNLLNQHMYKSITGKDVLNDKVDLWYDAWKKSHQPFHWLAEYYQIIQGNGGFDVIIGNPPYVVYTKKDKTTRKAICDYYQITGYDTENCNNLYAFVIERCNKISTINAKIGMIIPISGFSNSNMIPLQKLLKNLGGSLYLSTFHQRPAQLFVGVLQRLCIFISSKGLQKSSNIYTTGIYRWYSETRDTLFRNLSFVEDAQKHEGSFIKIGTNVELSIKCKFYSQKAILGYLGSSRNNSIYYRSAGGGYWISILNNPFDSQTTSNREAQFKSGYSAKIFSAYLNSSLFWWYYSTNYDLFNFTEGWVFGSCLTYPTILGNELICLSDELENSLRRNAYHYTINSRTNGLQETVTYRKYLSKDIMDEIDKVLAKHYGFTEEELDFIINYDIKYRMGDELSNE